MQWTHWVSITDIFVHFLAAAAIAAFFALMTSASSLYLFMQSFLDLLGTASAILSHLSGVEAGNVLSACSSSFCSSGDQAVLLTPASSAGVSSLWLALDSSLHRSRASFFWPEKRFQLSNKHNMTWHYKPFCKFSYAILLTSSLSELMAKFPLCISLALASTSLAVFGEFECWLINSAQTSHLIYLSN